MGCKHKHEMPMERLAYVSGSKSQGQIGIAEHTLLDGARCPPSQSSLRLKPTSLFLPKKVNGCGKQVHAWSLHPWGGSLVSVDSYPNKTDLPAEFHPGFSAETRFGTTDKPPFATILRRLQTSLVLPRNHQLWESSTMHDHCTPGVGA